MEKQDRIKIVVGLDFTGPSEVALRQALQLAKRGAADELHAVHVTRPADLPDTAERPAWQATEEVLERAPDELRGKVVELATAMNVSLRNLETFVHVRIGEHAETLYQVAVDYDADLIVVGSHNRNLIDRLMLGSVSEHLVRNARCPVLVAREKTFEGAQKTVLPDEPYKPGEEPKYNLDEGRYTERLVWSPSERGAPTGVRIV